MNSDREIVNEDQDEINDSYHEKWIFSINQHLFNLISTDENLLRYFNDSNQMEFQKKILQDQSKDSMILVIVQCFDQSLIYLNIQKNARIFQLKKSLEKTFHDRSINWKSVWNRYSLITNDKQILNNNYRSIKHYQIVDQSQLRFIRHHRSK